MFAGCVDKGVMIPISLAVQQSILFGFCRGVILSYLICCKTLVLAGVRNNSILGTMMLC